MGGGASVFLGRAANKGPVFYARHIAGVAQGQKTIGPLGRVEALHRSCSHQGIAQALVFGRTAVAPIDVARLGQGSYLSHPLDQASVFDGGGNVQAQAFQSGTIHGNSIAVQCNADDKTPSRVWERECNRVVTRVAYKALPHHSDIRNPTFCDGITKLV